MLARLGAIVVQNICAKAAEKAVFVVPPLGTMRRQQSYCVFIGGQFDRPGVTLRKPWTQVCRAAKLNDARLLDLRQRFASADAGNGRSFARIVKRLGHSHPLATMRGAHPAASTLHAAADSLGDSVVETVTRLSKKITEIV